ncbi:MAG: response regulator [Myxococcales bacterium]|nr:response regulator [Myxococcales bacterium]
MLDALEDAVCIEDAAGIILECNGAFCDLVGVSKRELIGADGGGLRPRLLECEDTWEVQRREFQTEDGAQRTLVRLRDRSRELAKEQALVQRAKELEQSERKLAEILSRQRSIQHAQRLESVGQLTGGVAHDFNNLLAVITGCLELLKVRAGENRPVIELADRALTAAERGAALVQRLLAFSRRQMLNPEPTDVNSLVVDVLELSRRSLGEHIEIETQLSEELWSVLVDASQLENAVLNLVINARDAMPDGGILMVSTERFRVDAPEDGLVVGDYVKIAVSDTGSGIPREHLGRVFEPFFTTKETGRGSGLGLSMVYGFVTQSHGAVRIHSEAEAGTTVELFLPRVGFVPNEEIEESSEQPRGRGELVLVVEDDLAVRRTVVSVLEELGYRVLEASTAADAFELLQQTKVDLLLTDVVLGGTASGPELVQRAVERIPELNIIFMTGYADQHLSAVGRDAHILKKPFRAPELARLLREVLKSTH